MNKMYSKSVKNPIDKGLPLTMAFRNDYPPHKTPRNNKPHLRWIFFYTINFDGGTINFDGEKGGANRRFPPSGRGPTDDLPRA